MARRKKLRALDDYLKPLQRRRSRRLDQGEGLAVLLERRAAKQKKET